MKFSNITNLPEFFKAIDQCQGDVFLLTPAGDKLNLKSQITKYIAFTEVFKDATMQELELQFTNTDDAAHMIAYIIY